MLLDRDKTQELKGLVEELAPRNSRLGLAFADLLIPR
jgi:hypothetical protein